MSNLEAQLVRLRRHYEAAVRGYDEASLLDLAHVLRVWADLRTMLPPAFTSTVAFKSAQPAKRVRRLVEGSKFVFAYFGGGVTTFASGGAIMSAREGGPDGTDFTVASRVRINGDGSIDLDRLFFSSIALSQAQIALLDTAEVNRGNYTHWLSSEAIRVGLTIGTTHQTVRLTRDVLIRKVANTLGGSHPENPDRNDDADAVALAVDYLLRFRWGGIALPYFVLLKCAQDLIDIGPKLMGSST